MESNFNPKAKNPKSTAAGLYQFTEDSLVTAVNRLANTIGEDKLPQWASEARKHKDARKLSEKEQQILFYADMFQKKGSDNLLKKVLVEGDGDAMVEYYSKLHHTDVDKPTQKRIDKIRKKYAL
jgi:muramidase (phage lysozyme)